MRKLLSYIMFASALLATVPAMAGVREGAFTLSPVVGGYTFDGVQHLETMPVIGLRAGYNFTKYFGAEALFDYGRTDGTKGANSDTDFYRYGADLLLHLLPDSKVVPYLAAGYGGMTLDFSDQKNMNRGIFDYGAGVKVFLTERMALRGDLRHLVFKGDNRGIAEIDSRTLSNYEYTLGLSYQFGGSSPAAKPVPPPVAKPAPAPVEAAKPLAAPVAPELDSDGDGVIDKRDKCPDTPQGVKVDAAGCPLDTDGDGVFDYLDKCPGTPKGVKVDKNGCPVDTDGDGVFDYLDKCPGTPKDVKVDKDGCPVDTDGDGVADYLDKCPDTPKGVKVDQKGCPLDTDGDGVLDYLDKCPDTPKGAPVDNDGCQLPEKVSLSIEVEFDTAKADVKKKYYDELKKVGDFMNKYPSANGQIEGHTDNVGNKEANVKLSQRRAESVRNYIIKNFGIDPGRLSAKGYGQSKPIADNATAQGRQKNRRTIATLNTVVKQK